MMKSLDDGVGRVLRTLSAAGTDRNTLVIFTSDNGGERFSYNWPFRGVKFSLYEGGIRVPAIVRWPGIVKPGMITDQPVITMDWTRTMIAAAGTRPAADFPLDGVDLTPVLAGNKRPADRTFFWRTSAQKALRSGKWKYISNGKDESLYDLSLDEREQADFRVSESQTLERLRGQMAKWESEVLQYPKGRTLRKLDN
jgi:arylsulfatase A-like enzyme